MAYAVEFLLNAEKTDRVLQMWQEMAAHGYGDALQGRPHLTLGVWDDLDPEATCRFLDRISRSIPRIPVRFASTGFFANELAVIFLAAIATPGLLTLQTRVCSQLRGSLWRNYRKDFWVPHVTLAMGVTHQQFPGAMQQAAEIGLPCEGVLEAITLVELETLRDCGTFPLCGDPGDLPFQS